MTMLIEYYATLEEDRALERALQHFEIKEWFNPEDTYYVLETDDTTVITIMAVFGIEAYITDRNNEHS